MDTVIYAGKWELEFGLPMVMVNDFFFNCKIQNNIGIAAFICCVLHLDLFFFCGLMFLACQIMNYRNCFVLVGFKKLAAVSFS